MKWKEKIAAEILRITGIQLSSDQPDAAFLDSLEEIPSLTQAIESSEVLNQLQEGLTALTSRIETIEAGNGEQGGVSADDLTAAVEAAINPTREGLQEVVESVAQLKASTAKDKVELTKAINAVKLASSKGQTHTPDPPPATPGADDEDEDDETINMTMDHFMKGSKVTGGLNIQNLT